VLAAPAAANCCWYASHSLLLMLIVTELPDGDFERTAAFDAVEAGVGRAADAGAGEGEEEVDAAAFEGVAVGAEAADGGALALALAEAGAETITCASSKSDTPKSGSRVRSTGAEAAAAE
jgi:hypothetical protein